MRGGREGRGLRLRVMWLLPWMAAPFFYLLHPPSMNWSALDLPGGWRWLGVWLGACCVLLIVRVHRSLGANFTPALRLREQHTLVTSGPYRYVRHPMYTAAVLMWLASGLIAANGFIGLGSFAFLSFALKRIPDEEAMMVEAFGEEYRSYQQRTGALFPKLGSAAPAG